MLLLRDSFKKNLMPNIEIAIQKVKIYFYQGLSNFFLDFLEEISYNQRRLKIRRTANNPVCAFFV